MPLEVWFNILIRLDFRERLRDALNARTALYSWHHRLELKHPWHPGSGSLPVTWAMWPLVDLRHGYTACLLTWPRAFTVLIHCNCLTLWS